MPPLNLLIKPVSGSCNMACRYCFYADIASNRSVGNMGFLKRETVDLLLREAFANTEPGGQVSFAFQGGEPTLAGLDLFEYFTRQAQAQKPKDVTVSYSIQTNGTLLDEHWIPLLKRYDFLVGISIDGYKELHNHYRVDAHGADTWKTVIRTFQRLQEAGIRANALCVVTGQCARHPDKVYGELKKSGARFLQFIPCLDPVEAGRGTMPFSLTPEGYGQFLCRLFDLWYADWEKGDYHSVRLFEDYIQILLGHRGSVTCATGGRCGAYFVVEGDGSVYPCDFFVFDRWKLGVIGENSLAEMANSPQAREFFRWGMEKPADCPACRWFRLCNGGCKNDWERNGMPRNHYCDALKMFFAHSETRLLRIARAEMQARQQQERQKQPGNRTGNSQ